MTYIKRKYKAFTLIEMLVVIALIGVISAIAYPSYQGMIAANRISNMTSTLHAAMLFTRNEAITRGGNVVICRSRNADINPICSAANFNPMIDTGWAEGWIIFLDTNGNNTYQAGNDTLIRVQGPMLTDPELGSIVPSPIRRSFTYNATGQTFGAFVELAVNPPDGIDASYERFICIAAGGRARVSKDMCDGN